MSYTFNELKKKSVVELREIAAGLQHEAVQGYTQMNKEHLIPAICKVFNIDVHAHHHAELSNKGRIKARMRELKTKRDEALSAHDSEQLASIRRQIHNLKRTLRKALV